MTTLLSQASEIVYPSSDGEPLAETSVHVDAIIDVVVVLRQYPEGRSAIVLADQFLYYAQGYPKLRLAFYREDTGEKLLASNELAQTLREEILARQQAEERAEQEHQRAEQERQRAEQAEAQVAQLKERLRSLGVDPDALPE